MERRKVKEVNAQKILTLRLDACMKERKHRENKKSKEETVMKIIIVSRRRFPLK